MSQVLVTGANGQLGREIKKLRNYFSQIYTFTDIEELDVTSKKDLDRYLAAHPVDYIINCAAYTDVDGAESEPEKAMQLNGEAIGHLVQVLESFPETKLIHISTDYVFRGDIIRPLREDDRTDPVSVYGMSKLEGEKKLKDHPRALVMRTSWLFSLFGKNFVKTMINKMDLRDQVRVVYDQIGTPTYAEDLARAIMQIISNVEEGKKLFTPGIFHYSNEGVCSWYDLAMEVCRQNSCKGNVIPVESTEYPMPAARPAYSVLNKAKIKAIYGVEVPYWRNSLEKCIKNLL
jgi:dTDP-4-dehydrorhamnose reductase